MKIKACVDCKYYKHIKFGFFKTIKKLLACDYDEYSGMVCTHPKFDFNKFDYLNGEVKNMKSCPAIIDARFYLGCGDEGKLYEPKN